MPRPRIRPVPAAAITIAAWAPLLVAGCGQSADIRPDDIRTYTVPREVTRESPRPRSAEPAREAGRPRYEVPEGWSDKGPSPMRLTTLVIGDPDDRHEVTLSEAAGTLRANVDRWQGQLDPGIDPAARAAAVDRALESATMLDVDGAQATVVELFDAAAAADPEADGRAILGAVIPLDDRMSLFVKYMGDAAVARRERGNFVRFVSSIRWK